MKAEELAERVAMKWFVETEVWLPDNYDGLVRLIASELRAAGWDRLLPDNYDGLVRLIASELRAAGWDRLEAMEAALRELLAIQGNIIPGWNDEFIRRSWVAEIAEKALKEPGPAPPAPSCTEDTSHTAPGPPGSAPDRETG